MNQVSKSTDLTESERQELMQFFSIDLVSHSREVKILILKLT